MLLNVLIRKKATAHPVITIRFVTVEKYVPMELAPPLTAPPSHALQVCQAVIPQPARVFALVSPAMMDSFVREMKFVMKLGDANVLP